MVCSRFDTGGFIDTKEVFGYPEHLVLTLSFFDGKGSEITLASRLRPKQRTTASSEYVSAGTCNLFGYQHKNVSI